MKVKNVIASDSKKYILAEVEQNLVDSENRNIFIGSLLNCVIDNERYLFKVEEIIVDNNGFYFIKAYDYFGNSNYSHSGLGITKFLNKEVNIEGFK